MRFGILLAALVLCCTVVATSTGAHGGKGEPSTVILHDFDKDGVLDRVELVMRADDGTADLILETVDEMIVLENFVFSAPVAGQEAALMLNEAGSIQVLSGNLSVGRNRWDQTLTLAWRDGRFRLAGITRSWWDALTSSSDGNCDVNYLSGKGIANGSVGAREIRIETLAPDIAEWDRTLPEACLS